MSSDDGADGTLRPCTRSHARAISPSAERASAGKNATPVRAAMPSAPSRATMLRAEFGHPLAVVLEQDHLVFVGAVRRQHVARPHMRRHHLADRLGRRPGRDVQPHHREHPPRRRRLVALLFQAALEVGVRRQPAHAHGGPAALDHQRRPADRDRLARQHRARAARAPAGRRAGGCRSCCPSPRSPAPRPTCSRAWWREAFASSMRTSSSSSRPIDTTPCLRQRCIENMFAPITIRCSTPSSTGRSSTSRTVRAPDAVARRRFVGVDMAMLLAVDQPEAA